MNTGKKIPNKNELLDWLNNTLKPDGIAYTKVQQLGTGVGYLILLNHIHPGILTGVKINKKPNNQYEYHLNLKLLVSAFTKLGITKHVDIQKLTKLKMQDNLSMLQWFYAYAHTFQANKQESQVVRDPQVVKKIKVKAPQKLNVVISEKSTKMDIQQSVPMELKIISSATKRINKIESVIRDQHMSNDQIKLNRIIEILNLRPKSGVSTPIQKRRVSPQNNKQQVSFYLQNDLRKQNQNENIQQNQQKDDKNQVTYVKCRKLQQKYEQYINHSNSILKKQDPHQIPSFSKSKRQSVKLSATKQIFEYDQSEHPSARRLTDNSILLNQNSDRKSIMSETNLLLNDE